MPPLHPDRPSASRARALLWVGALWAALGMPLTAAAQDKAGGSPYAHGLRFLIFPVTFSTGISQSAFGSALRGELDLGRAVMLQAGGGVGWAPLGGDTGLVPYNLRLGASFALSDRMSLESLDGTVYSTDAPSVGAQRRGTDSDMEVPTSQKLGGPPPPIRERGEYQRAHVRTVHALRAGYDLQRLVANVSTTGDGVHARVHAVTLGYGWSTHWNLLPHEAGERALGYRRFYVDLLGALPAMYIVDRPAPADPSEPPASGDDDLLFGARLGMEGAFAALLRSAEALGFGYSIELGVLSDGSRAEGYLLIGLGLALEIE